MRVWALAWLVVVVLGAIVFGERWFAVSDPFEVYSTTIARLSPWHRTGDTLRLVNPLAGLTAWRPPPGAVGVVAVLLGSTAFDSFTNTSRWIQHRAVLRRAERALGHRRAARDDPDRAGHLRRRGRLDGPLRRPARPATTPG